MKICNMIWALPCCNPAVLSLQSSWWAEVLLQKHNTTGEIFSDFLNIIAVRVKGMLPMGTPVPLTAVKGLVFLGQEGGEILPMGTKSTTEVLPKTRKKNASRDTL